MSEHNNAQFSWDIPLNHPSSNGHFDGNPIIPGAVILEYVRQSLANMKGLKLRGIGKVKFMKSLRPGDTLLVTFEQQMDKKFNFRCHNSKHETIVAGDLSVS